MTLMGEVVIISNDGRGARILSEGRGLYGFAGFFGLGGSGRIVLVEEHDAPRPREVAAAGD